MKCLKGCPKQPECNKILARTQFDSTRIYSPPTDLSKSVTSPGVDSWSPRPVPVAADLLQGEGRQPLDELARGGEDREAEDRAVLDLRHLQRSLGGQLVCQLGCQLRQSYAGEGTRLGVHDLPPAVLHQRGLARRRARGDQA